MDLPALINSLLGLGGLIAIGIEVLKYLRSKSGVSASSEEQMDLLAEKRGLRIAELALQNDRFRDDIKKLQREKAILDFKLEQAGIGIADVLLTSEAKDKDGGPWLLGQTGLLWVVTHTHRGTTLPGESPATFVWMAGPWEETFGWPVSDWLGSGWWNLLVPRYRTGTIKAEARANIRWGTHINAYRHKDGREIPVEWFFREYNGGGSTLAFVRVLE